MQKTTMIIFVILILILVLFFFVRGRRSSVSTGPNAAVYRKISAQEAKALMDGEAAVTIVDVRTSAEFAGSHIPHAINIANESIGGSMPTLLPDLDATILVYCRSGARSAQASKKLLALGYTEVYDFGGIIHWPFETVQ